MELHEQQRHGHVHDAGSLRRVNIFHHHDRGEREQRHQRRNGAEQHRLADDGYDEPHAERRQQDGHCHSRAAALRDHRSLDCISHSGDDVHGDGAGRVQQHSDAVQRDGASHEQQLRDVASGFDSDGRCRYVLSNVSDDRQRHDHGNRHGSHKSDRHLEQHHDRWHAGRSPPSGAFPGIQFAILVTAKDLGGNAVSGYSGTVQFASSDTAATLPSSGSMSSGLGTFLATLKTLGNQTITVTDSVTGLTGTSAAIPVGGSFQVSAPSYAGTNTPVSFTVTVVYPNAPRQGSYGGTVHFTSSDPSAALQGDSTLTNGTGTFPATFATPGNQTITATDTTYSGVTGTSSSIAVGVTLAVSAPSSASPNCPTSFTVTAKDSSGNTATLYSGTVHFTSSDASASLPPNSTLTNGVGTFSVTFATLGNQTITATDTAASSITGSGSATAVAGNFTVTNTNDSGCGSLRQAILDANQNADTNTIAFSLPPSSQTITLASGITITNPISIDGSQSGSPLFVQITGNGLTITGNGSTIRGFAFYGSTGPADDQRVGQRHRGQLLRPARGRVCSRRHDDRRPHHRWLEQRHRRQPRQPPIATSSPTAPTRACGSNGNHLNGGVPEHRPWQLDRQNTSGSVASNGIGVEVTSSSNVVIGGTTGTTPEVPAAAPATSFGRLPPGGSRSHRQLPQRHNPGQLRRGQFLRNRSSVEGGPNGPNINVDSSTAIAIGGTTAAARNVIAGAFGTAGNGIRISGGGTTVTGNYIGLDTTGSQPLGNSANGIFLDTGSSGNVIGGTAAGAGNVISFNGLAAISTFPSCSNNVIQGNIIGLSTDQSVMIPNISTDSIFIDSLSRRNPRSGASTAGGGGGTSYEAMSLSIPAKEATRSSTTCSTTRCTAPRRPRCRSIFWPAAVSRTRRAIRFRQAARSRRTIRC